MMPFARILYAFARSVLSSESPRLIAPVFVFPSVNAFLSREAGSDGIERADGTERMEGKDSGVTERLVCDCCPELELPEPSLVLA